MAKKKARLDVVASERFSDCSLPQVQTWIMQGAIRVNGVIETKSGTQVPLDAEIECTAKLQKFVGRAGFKLEKALDHFAIDVTDFVCLDAGIATGGFTDCLLQRGASKVYGIDVGYGDVHEKIRKDTRVVLFERTNLRYITPEQLGERIDIVTLDLSFISVLKVLDVVRACMKDIAHLVILIKPQFEADKKDVGPGGIITDSEIHERVITKITNGVQAHGFLYHGVTESPILGKSGNKEFLAYFEKR